MVRVGDKVRIKSCNIIVTVEEICVGQFGYMGFWSHEVPIPYFYKRVYGETVSTKMKNWYNAGDLHIEILPKDKLTPLRQHIKKVSL